VKKKPPTGRATTQPSTPVTSTPTPPAELSLPEQIDLLVGRWQMLSAATPSHWVMPFVVVSRWMPDLLLAAKGDRLNAAFLAELRESMTIIEGNIARGAIERRVMNVIDDQTPPRSRPPRLPRNEAALGNKLQRLVHLHPESVLALERMVDKQLAKYDTGGE
jgi:hypothetical protein